MEFKAPKGKYKVTGKVYSTSLAKSYDIIPYYIEDKGDGDMTEKDIDHMLAMKEYFRKINKEDGLSETQKENAFKKQEKVRAFDTQVAGNHYSKLKIQPMEYNLANDLNYGQANAIKYVTRYKDKNGIEDLKKAIHCIELLIEFESRK